MWSALVWMVLGLTAQADDSIIGGSTTSSYASVGQIAGYSDRYGLAPFCSGTLVRDTWVVTAAHCVDGAEEYIRYGMDIVFIVGSNVTSSSGIDDYAYVTEMFLHPDYDLPNYDVGLMELDGPGLPDVPKIPLNDDGVMPDWVDSDITYVGWGISSDRGSGAGVKRTVDVPIYAYDRHIIITYDPTGQSNICSGDSGGAALRMDEDLGELELVGVNSFGFMMNGSSTVLCEDPNAAAGVSRVDDSYDWFMSVMGPEPEPEPEPEPGDTGTTSEDGTTDDDAREMGESTAVVPEDSSKGGCAVVSGSVASMGLALFGVAATRRRRY